jgi:RimJ/RimL family protein N-acetyltransferase
MLESWWPLFDLTVVGPRLTLRYVTDALAIELATLAGKGIHAPGAMPFMTPWSAAAEPELQRNVLRHYWGNRAALTQEHWVLDLAACVETTVIGMCAISSTEFAVSRTAETGSWIGMAYQGRGYGTELRMASLELIFTGFDGREARTSAWQDNVASLAVTRKLGYRALGARTRTRGGGEDKLLDFALQRDEWYALHRPSMRIEGTGSARSFLGV